MKDSKTKEEESTRLTYTGLRHSCCNTYLDSQFRRGRQRLPGNLPFFFFNFIMNQESESKRQDLSVSVR